jgi:ethanolamine ammonia-lyase large subunit
MNYEKDKIRRLIEYKDEVDNTQIKNDLEWIVASYNEYFVNSKDYEYQSKEYKTILNKYYVAEDEKANLKEELILIKRKYKVLKQSCEKSKDVV